MKKFISVFIIFMLGFSFVSAPISHASAVHFSSNEELEIDQEFIEELSEIANTDFTDVDMSNFEEEFAFLINDPVYKEFEERLLLDSQEITIEEGSVSGQWVPIAVAAIRLLTGKVGKTAMKKAWAIARPHVNKALKEVKRYKFYINTKSGRYIGIIDNKSKKKQKTIFALDYHKYKVNHKSTTGPVLHYHLGSNLNKHYPIYPAKPKFVK